MKKKHPKFKKYRVSNRLNPRQNTPRHILIKLTKINHKEKIFEDIIVENFPKVGKEIITQVQETQRVPNRINPRQNTARHILIKLTKIKHTHTKKQILKAARGKQQITHKGIPITITADLSIETLQARRQWQDILKVMKDNNLQPRLLYPARISFKLKEKSKAFQTSNS